MFRTLLLFLMFVPAFASAELLDCEQKQNLCLTACSVTNLGDEAGLNTCKSKCYGERVSCSLQAGMDNVKETTEKLKQSASQEKIDQWKQSAEAFLQGLKGDSTDSSEDNK